MLPEKNDTLMANNVLVELRSTIAVFSEGLVRQDNDDIFAKFEAEHRPLLERASRDLFRMAFIKLLNDVSGRQRRVTADTAQPDLFGKAKHPKLIQVPIYKDGKLIARERVDFDKASIADVQAWRALKRAPKKGRQISDDGIDEMLTLILQYIDDQSMPMAEAVRVVKAKLARTSGGEALRNESASAV
jgi:hypothetical protein